MANKTTRTLNPLPFDALEPHRFEDMVRSLVYGFRAWTKIEPLGRSGSDDGIDIRAIEGGEVLTPDGEDDDEVEARPERVWFIQCKREKKLGPAQVRKIVRDGVPSAAPPYGYILAAACELSKKAVDAFNDEAVKRGVREFHVWGKGSLEDMLLQPKNDHLLFTFFGISLQVRRRSLRSLVRSRLATKRAAVSALGHVRPEHDHLMTVFIRDPVEDRYPKAKDIPDFATFPRWQAAWFYGHQPPDHLCFIVQKHFAFADESTEQWDADHSYAIRPTMPKDPEEPRPFDDIDMDEQYQRHFKAWKDLVPFGQQAMLLCYRTIHYDRVIAFDADGDFEYGGPHVLVEFSTTHGLFEPAAANIIYFENGSRSHFKALDEQRIDIFPKEPSRPDP